MNLGLRTLLSLVNTHECSIGSVTDRQILTIVLLHQDLSCDATRIDQDQTAFEKKTSDQGLGC